jgi:hypothetical protein
MKKKYYLFLEYGLILDSFEVDCEKFFKVVDNVSKFYEVNKFESAFDNREIYSYYDPNADVHVSLGYVKEVKAIF